MKTLKSNRFKEKSQAHFNETAAYYDQSFDGKYVLPMYKDIFEIMKDWETGNILDVGCGTGNVLLNMVNGKRKLYGIDLSEAMIEIAKKRLENQAEILIADAEKLPFPGEKFDVIICNASFHHYPHPEKVLEEMRRILKPHGVLIIGEGYAFEPFRTFLNLSFRYSKSGDYHTYGIHELKNLIEKTGYKVIHLKRRGMRLFLEAAVE